MPAKSLDPLRKVTVDLFSADVDYLKANSKGNFSEVVRQLLRNHVVMMKAREQRLKLGSLLNAR